MEGKREIVESERGSEIVFLSKKQTGLDSKVKFALANLPYLSFLRRPLPVKSRKSFIHSPHSFLDFQEISFPFLIFGSYSLIFLPLLKELLEAVYFPSAATSHTPPYSGIHP